MWSWGAEGISPPAWAARIAYAERFGIEPHQVNPPIRWWVRLSELDSALRARRVREAVDARGLESQSVEDRRVYDQLVKRMRQ